MILHVCSRPTAVPLFAGGWSFAFPLQTCLTEPVDSRQSSANRESHCDKYGGVRLLRLRNYTSLGSTAMLRYSRLGLMRRWRRRSGPQEEPRSHVLNGDSHGQCNTRRCGIGRHAQHVGLGRRMLAPPDAPSGMPLLFWATLGRRLCSPATAGCPGLSGPAAPEFGC